jgi:HEAT repeat protein
LSHALRHDDATFVRSYAVYAMANIGGTLAVDILIGALNDPDIGVRGAAVLQLGKLGDPKAVDALILVLDDPDERSVEPVRLKAARALGEIGDSRAFDALRKMSQRDLVDSVRRVATEALRKVHHSG